LIITIELFKEIKDQHKKSNISTTYQIAPATTKDKNAIIKILK